MRKRWNNAIKITKYEIKKKINLVGVTLLHAETHAFFYKDGSRMSQLLWLRVY